MLQKANLHCQKLVTHAVRSIIYIVLHKFKVVIYSRIRIYVHTVQKEKVGLTFQANF